MITNQHQLKIAQQRIEDYQDRLQAMDSSKDALLRNTTIKQAYQQGLEKMINDLENQINVYKAKGEDNGHNASDGFNG